MDWVQIGEKAVLTRCVVGKNSHFEVQDGFVVKDRNDSKNGEVHDWWIRGGENVTQFENGGDALDEE